MEPHGKNPEKRLESRSSGGFAAIRMTAYLIDLDTEDAVARLRRDRGMARRSHDRSEVR
jgi:hypothetical protein